MSQPVWKGPSPEVSGKGAQGPGLFYKAGGVAQEMRIS